MQQPAGARGRTDGANRRGRPVSPRRRQRVKVSITLDQDAFDEVCGIAIRGGMSFSRVLELAAVEYLKSTSTRPL